MLGDLTARSIRSREEQYLGALQYRSSFLFRALVVSRWVFLIQASFIYELPWLGEP